MFGSKQPSVVRDCVAVRPPRLGLSNTQTGLDFCFALSKLPIKTFPDFKMLLQRCKAGSLLAFHQPSRSITVTSPPHKRLSLAAPPNQGALSGFFVETANGLDQWLGCDCPQLPWHWSGRRLGAM